MEQSVREWRSKVLRPFNKMRNIFDRRTVLVIAAEGCLSIPDDLQTFTEGSNGVYVRYATKLPLLRPDKHSPVDAVALVYKVFNSESLKAITDSLPFIDVSYFVGKCFIIVYSDSAFCADDISAVQTVADSFHLPLHFASKKQDPSKPDRKACLHVPPELVSIYCPPVYSDVNSLLIDATMVDDV